MPFMTPVKGFDNSGLPPKPPLEAIATPGEPETPIEAGGLPPSGSGVRVRLPGGELPSAGPQPGPRQTRNAPTVLAVRSRDGTTIAFERLGAGPAIVLVSSALVDRAGTAKLAKLLAERFTVINYDRRRRGHSSDTHPYAAQREVQDIEALMDAAGGSA